MNSKPERVGLQKTDRTGPHMSYEVDTFKGSPVDVAWLKTKRGKLVQRELNNMFRREAHHRQMMDAYPYGTDMHKYHRKMRNAWAGRITDYQNKYGIRAVPRANVSDYLKPIDDLLSKGFRVISGPSSYTGDAAIVRGLGMTVGNVKKIERVSVRMKLADGKTRTLTYGDEAGASLWVSERAVEHPEQRHLKKSRCSSGGAPTSHERRLGNRTGRGGGAKMRKCPFCAEEIQDEAIRCRYCGEMLTEKPQATVAPAPQVGKPVCQHCGGEMRKRKEAKSSGMGCLLIVIGILLTPVIIGIPLIVYGAHIGSKRRGLWVCKHCGYQMERKMKWYEYG